MYGDTRVEELISDDDEDGGGHGGSLSARRQTRFVSDSLQFTGTDLGDRSAGIARRGYPSRHSDSDNSDDDDDDDDDSEQTSDSDNDDEENYTEDSYTVASSHQSLRAKEEALLQSALKRINRAQARGRTDVKLNKEEIAALERRRKRIEEEAERMERERAARASGGSGNDKNKKKKHKEQRLAVPLSHFEPISRKKHSGLPPPQDMLPSSRPSSSVGRDSPDNRVYPPMGYFAPPFQSRSKSNSDVSHHPGSGARDAIGSSPLAASYQHSRQHAANYRYASDSMTGYPSRGLPHEDSWNPRSAAFDPFQYQVDGPRLGQPMNAPFASSNDYEQQQQQQQQQQGHAAPWPATKSRRGSGRQSLNTTAADSETSEEDMASEAVRNGAQTRRSARGRRREEEIVVEVSPELEPEAAKKKSLSPKKKSAPNGGRKKRK